MGVLKYCQFSSSLPEFLSLVNPILPYLLNPPMTDAVPSFSYLSRECGSCMDSQVNSPSTFYVICHHHTHQVGSPHSPTWVPKLLPKWVCLHFSQPCVCVAERRQEKLALTYNPFATPSNKKVPLSWEHKQDSMLQSLILHFYNAH